MKIIKNHHIGFLKNIILNILGFALITGTVQLVLYPFLGRIMIQSEYGLAITLIGFANLFTAIFGNSLVSSKLRLQKQYEDHNVIGDFNLLFYIGLIMNILFVAVMSFTYNSELSVMNILLVVLMSALAHFRIYFSVHFRIHLNFKRLLILSAVTCAGYIIGMIIAKITGIWQLAFIMGELAGSLYVFFTCDTIKESLRTTSLFKKTSGVYVSLIMMVILSSIPMYADRLFLYPVLGAESVAIYYVAVFFGRTIGAITTPISQVIMSYYSKQESLSLKTFWKRNVYIFLLSISFILASLVLSYPITKIFYPTLIEQAIPYLVIANIAMIILFTNFLIAPVLTKFVSIRNIFTVGIVTAVIYLTTSFTLTDRYGLIGFCYAMLITNIISLIMRLLIGSISIEKQKDN